MPKRLSDQPKSINELDFSEFIRRVPIAEFKRAYVPEPVKLKKEVERWNYRRAMGDPDMQCFSIHSEITGNTYRFLTRVDWRGLFVPLGLVPPTEPAHEIYKKYNEYKNIDELRGEPEIRDHARALINSYEKSEVARLNPECEPFVIFKVKNHSGALVPFLTRPSWRGLWVHEVIANDDLKVEPQNTSYRLYKSIDEIQGQGDVRLAAKRYLSEYEGVTSERMYRGRKYVKSYTLRLGTKRVLMLEDIKNYLASAAKHDDVRDIHAITWILDNAWIHLLPDDFKTVRLDPNEESLLGSPQPMARNGHGIRENSADKTDDQ